MKEAIFFVVGKFCTELFEVYNMCIQSSSSNFVSARFRYERLSESCKHGTCEHNRTTQASTFLAKGLTVEVSDVYIIRLETAGIGIEPLNLHIHVSQQLNQKINIE